MSSKPKFEEDELKLDTIKALKPLLGLSDGDWKSLIASTHDFIKANEEESKKTPRLWKKQGWQNLTEKFVEEEGNGEKFWNDQRASFNAANMFAWPEDKDEITFLVFCVLRMEAPKVLKRDRKSTTVGDEDLPDNSPSKPSSEPKKSKASSAAVKSPDISASPSFSSALREPEKGAGSSDTDASDDDLGETIMLGGPPVKKFKGDPFESVREQHNAVAAEVTKRPVKRTPQLASARKHARSLTTAPSPTPVAPSAQNVTAVGSLSPQVVIPRFSLAVQSLGRPTEGPLPEAQQKRNEIAAEGTGSSMLEGPTGVTGVTGQEDSTVEGNANLMEVDGAQPSRDTYQHSDGDYLTSNNDAPWRSITPPETQYLPDIPELQVTTSHRLDQTTHHQPTVHNDTPCKITFMINVHGVPDKQRYVTVNNDISWPTFYYSCVTKADTDQKYGIVDAKVMKAKIPIGTRSTGEIVHEEHVIEMAEGTAETQWRVLVHERLKGLEVDQGVGVTFS